jgi:hypothetical protein
MTTPGRPDVTGLPPAQQHTAVLASLNALDQAVADLSEAITQDQAATALPVAPGRRRIVERHAPLSDQTDPICASPTSIGERWPCPDYLDAADGLVDGLETP